MRTLKWNWIIKNAKHFLNLWIRNQRKTIIQILLLHTNTKLNIRMLWKKLLETKESPMPLFPILSPWKRDKYSAKKILRKNLIVILLISVPTSLPPFPKAKIHSKTIFTTMVLALVPSILQTWNWKMHLRALNQAKVQGIMYICRYFQKSVKLNIWNSEKYFQYLFSKGSLPR